MMNYHRQLTDSMIEGFFDFKYIFFVENIEVLILRFNVVLSALWENQRCRWCFVFIKHYNIVSACIENNDCSWIISMCLYVLLTIKHPDFGNSYVPHILFLATIINLTRSTYAQLCKLMRLFLTMCDHPSENQYSLHVWFWSFNGSYNLLGKILKFQIHRTDNLK